ncbi:unnamed protein product [Cunninghamella echinulata]
MTTAQGLKVAFLSGLFENNNSKTESMDMDEENNNNNNNSNEIMKPAYYNRSDIEQLKNTKFPLSIPYGVDILLTTEWPKEIENNSSNTTLPSSSLKTTSEIISELALALKPRYHFASLENKFYEREPYDNVMGFGGKDERPVTHVSRFIGLGKAFNNEKQRWFYAYNIVPLSKATPEILNMRPNNTTECPFWKFTKPGSRAGQKRSEVDDYKGFFWGDNQDQQQSKKRAVSVPDNYVCKICNTPGHFIKDCPQKEKKKERTLPEHYICKICNNTGHHIEDCPQKEKKKERTLPENYICKICNNAGHHIDQCPDRKSKTQRQAPDLSSCWFCLSNPKIEKHLITSIGNEIYATLAKGPLISPANSAVPGGGHILLIAITHYANFGTVPDGPNRDLVLADLKSYKQALRDFYAKYDQDMVTFEISRESYRGLNHAHIQVLPVPKNKSELIEQIAKQEAELANYDLIDDNTIPPSGDKAFFDMELPNGKHIVHIIPPKERFNLQFGRTILAKALDTPDREDWKACAQTEDEERKAANEFKKAFKSFDFTL